jgi:MFS family permease
MGEGSDSPGALSTYRQVLGLPGDVLVLSVAMLGFSLAFQMTGRYVPEYLAALNAGAGVVGLYGSVGNLIGAVYPYPGGAFSDRVGSRVALTLFAVASTAGFLVWALAPTLAFPVLVVFAGLFLSQAWKSFGLGATFAVVKQSTEPGRLARGFASTETFRRVGFLLGPLVAAAVLATTNDFVPGFQVVLALAFSLAVLATLAQHFLYDASEDTLGSSFGGLSAVRDDLRGLPDPLRPLLVADTLVRFANGMVYVFFVLVITRFLGVGFSGFGLNIGPAAFFGVLSGVEMAVALVSMAPVSRLAERVGLKPVVALGFFVYAAFPVLLISAPPDQWALVALFAFSGLRFAGLPAHKALIVGPAERDAGGRVTGSYYLARNAVVVPSAALGGVLYAWNPSVAFAVASAVGMVGVGYFLAYGEEFSAYR